MTDKAEKKWLDRWREKLEVTYRLVIINDDTFEEVNATKLTLLNLYTIASSVFVALIFVVFLLIIFTPVKRYIPGYGDFNARQKIIELEKQISNLEAEVNSYQSWTANIKKILVGDVDSTGEFEVKDTTNTVAKRRVNVPKIPEDKDLRQTIGEMEAPAETRVVNLEIQQKPLEQIYFIPPVSGEISLSFSHEKKHLGVDITAPKNTAIKSVLDGYVIFTDWTLETGNTICVQHSNNLISFYKHNSALLKQIGDIVTAGEAIAIIGDTGDHSTGPHLHFELWHEGKPVDPGDYVNFN